eukprot:14744767-Alexandrium_andersonii.AAC.1
MADKPAAATASVPSAWPMHARGACNAGLEGPCERAPTKPTPGRTCDGRRPLQVPKMPRLDVESEV